MTKTTHPDEPELLATMTQHRNNNGDVYYFGRLKDGRAVFLYHAPCRDDPGRFKLAARPYDHGKTTNGGPRHDDHAPNTTRWPGSRG